ncbi:hypothetical protein [Sulfitobacter sp. R18_1]|uniref:hypothetical protein n=1 Tax=Sulfitobacter sp. R18_1 TaxID=2821104 RepID=UPI001ADB4470|nr:hypothetical protein [Sulfitobacter sp. R18_1]MBO9427894.1 hypothetical protein [Sulfitobacter sp. R18_1]
MENKAPVVKFLMMSGCISLPFLAAAIITRGIYVPLQIGFLGSDIPALLDFRLALTILCLFALGRKATLGVLCGYATSLLIYSRDLPETSSLVEIWIPLVPALALLACQWMAPAICVQTGVRSTLRMMLGAAGLAGVTHAAFLLPTLGTLLALRTSILVAFGEMAGFFVLIAFGVLILRLERRQNVCT